MNCELFIYWNPSEIAFSIGSFAIRWYSLCWLIALLSAYYVIKKLYEDQKIKEEYFDPLFVYCFFGILIGARLGHCLFYEPDYFLSSGKHFVEMLLPIHFLPDGDWKYTGYAGLASHGGTLGLMIALWMYYKKTKISVWTVLDNIAIGTPISCFFIRMGNLMNSEIIGKPTDVPWAFIFERVDLLPRHPGQLYEALAYLFFFFVMLFFYRKSRSQEAKKSGSQGVKEAKSWYSHPVGSGWYFGLVLTLIFTFRFFIEWTKDIQVGFESQMLFNMGQILSIPYVLLGIACMRGGNWMRHLGTRNIGS